MAAEADFHGDNDYGIIHFFTGSHDKFQEVKYILGQDFPYKIYRHDVDLEEYQGTAENIVKHKVQFASQFVKGPVIVEDTSLCFNALNGLPGPYVKWFLKKIGPDGLYKMLQGWEDKSAFVECLVGFTAGQFRDVLVFKGRMTGVMIPPRGCGGFGFDCCFSPDNGNENLIPRLSFAEFNKDLRFSVSHRTKVFRQLKTFMLTANPTDIWR